MRLAARLALILATASLPGGWPAPVEAQAQAQGGGARANRGMGRNARGRFFAATGPTGRADLARLREAVDKLADAAPFEVGPHPSGAALRVGGSVASAELLAAGKAAGFNLRAVSAYVVSGPSAEADLLRLKSRLGQTAGTEQVETRALTGGATLIVYGEPQPATLVKAALEAGYTLWPLNDGGGARELRVDGNPDPTTQQKLKTALLKLPGVASVEIRPSPDGPRVSISGGRLRPVEISATAAEVGVSLTPVREVALPSLEPRAGRDTPPDFDEWVMDELTRPGAPAPDFSLLTKDGQTSLRLSDFRGKKPVVLMFGSCT